MNGLISLGYFAERSQPVTQRGQKEKPSKVLLLVGGTSGGGFGRTCEEVIVSRAGVGAVSGWALLCEGNL